MTLVDYYHSCPSSPQGEKKTIGSPSRSPRRKKSPHCASAPSSASTPKNLTKQGSVRRLDLSAKSIRQTLQKVPDLLSLSSHSCRGSNHTASGSRRGYGTTKKSYLVEDHDDDDSWGEEDDDFGLLAPPPLVCLDNDEGVAKTPKGTNSSSKNQETDEAQVLFQFEQQVNELSLMVEGKLVKYREASTRYFQLSQARYSQGSPRPVVLVALRYYAQTKQDLTQWENLQNQLKDLQTKWVAKLKKARRKKLPATMGLDKDGKCREALAKLKDKIHLAADGLLIDEDEAKSPSIDELWERMESSIEQWVNCR